jgi:hypothetical protein
VGNFDLTFPWDKGFGTPASSSMWRKMAQLWCSDGVVAGYQQSLTCTLSAGTVTVNPGACFIHGYYGEVINTQTITGVGSNGTVVAKADLVNEICLIYYKDQAVDYGGTTGYEQDANAWEIPLYLVSGTTLTDLRTMVSPGVGLGWWSSAPGPVSVLTSQTGQINFLTARIPYATWAILTGTMLLTFSDASQAQSAICQLTYQQGQSDQQLSTTITPGMAGTGAAGAAVSHPVALNGLIPVTQGKKTLGWRVTAGTGPQISVASLTLAINLVARPPAA